MTLSYEAVKARIDAVAGTTFDPKHFEWKTVLAFADLIGFKLKSSSDQDSRIHGGELSAEECSVQRLTFDNGAVWRKSSARR